MLQNRDYVLVVDKSGSMLTKDVGRQGDQRWKAAREGTVALAHKISELDPDGITVYTFAGSHKRYDNVGPEKVEQIWRENEPNGGTDLAGVLSAVFGDYQTRKAGGRTKENGELCIVVTDGEPNDKAAAAKVIREFTHTLAKDEEYALCFLQIGQDGSASEYLRHLDDDLTGAKFDIVDATTFDQAENMTFTELLTKAITD